MAEQIAVGLARELANERGLVAEERAVVLANDGNVVANVVAVEVSEHHEQRLEHVGGLFGFLRVHEGEQSGKKLVVVNDQFAARNQRKERAINRMSRESTETSFKIESIAWESGIEM